jgi:mRNA interferase RelE/StbE
MASFRIEYDRQAEREYGELAPRFVQRITEAVSRLGEEPFPRQSKKLAGEDNVHRLRVGTYRVIYEVDLESQTTTVYRIRHRRDAYRNL